MIITLSRTLQVDVCDQSMNQVLQQFNDVKMKYPQSVVARQFREKLQEVCTDSLRSNDLEERVYDFKETMVKRIPGGMCKSDDIVLQKVKRQSSHGGGHLMQSFAAEVAARASKKKLGHTG
eukprot:GFYU01003977.1.p1 GENE.GFYU01003977.1~~GFYU01003977.1.p1  ORF type:complete len:121 (-),score=14.00 GFYU01003977.1:169-531(-)